MSDFSKDNPAQPPKSMVYLLRHLPSVISVTLVGFQIHDVLQFHPLVLATAVFGILLSLSIPVAVHRNRPITVAPSVVFTASLLLNGASAGTAVIIAMIVYATRGKHGTIFRLLATMSGFTLGALVSSEVYRVMATDNGIVGKPTFTRLGIVLLSSITFVAIELLFIAYDRLFSEQSRSQSYVRNNLLARAVSFPVAVLTVLVYPSVGPAILPFMVALLAACSFTIHLSVENSGLQRQLAAARSLAGMHETGTEQTNPLARFLELARELIGYESADVWVFDEVGAFLTINASSSRNDASPAIGEYGPDTFHYRTAMKRKPVLVANTATDPRFKDEGKSMSWLLYPLVFHGHSIGIVQFARSAQRPYSEGSTRALSALASQAAAAYESVFMRSLMHRYASMATTDSLTGLLNHLRSHDILKIEVKRAERYHRPLSVMMLDVDSFKHFNDNYGHPQGDVLLRAIARILRANVRTVDYVGRYGGEEFIILLPETALQEALTLAERIRFAVEHEYFPIGKDQTVQKTISIGVASYPADAQTGSDLVRAADDALYRAKREGKNRVLTP